MRKACIFDLDGTLLDRSGSIPAFLKRQHERFYEHLGHIPFDSYKEQFIHLDQRGYVWKNVVYQQLLEHFQVNDIDAETLLDDYVENFHLDCQAFTGVVDTLQQLRSNGIALGMITNGRTKFQLKNLRAIGIEAYFQTILISEQEGMAKPAKEIFEKALSLLQVRAEEAIYVGDHPVNDVQAARAIGMKGIWKRDEYWPVPAETDGIIDHIPDLLAHFVK
ncbi:HAD family hydrolase [Brevibacillus reuszeri]|uniref:HAD family hydrolase n=1 Tax=Brevibacillus reuszeri TaxID=54915 RepID=UPI00289CE9D8|nr:HAD-IA family hydrolase [Brevibacillus reuszeri]